MSKVDWSLAPDDATHFSPMTNEYIDHWVKRDGRDSYFCVTGFEKDGWKREGCMGDDRPLIERPKQPQAWSGPEDGLPPVGFMCEAELYKGGGWIEGFVAYYGKAHFIFESTQLTVGVEISGKIRTSAFRTIRTPEQQAADKRESAIRELMDIAQVDCRVTAARLVDAGFKREVV